METKATKPPLGRGKLILGLVVLLGLLILLSLASIAIGSRNIPLDHTLRALFDFQAARSEDLIIWYSRIPRTILAILVAAALGCAGLIMQAMTRNPLADPGIFGINAGAAFAVVVIVAIFRVDNYVPQVLAAMAGAALSGLIIYLLSGVRRGIDPTKLVLAGTAFNVVIFALVQIVLVNSDETVYDFYRQWIVGSFAGRTNFVIVISLIAIMLAIALGYVFSRQLDAQLLGADMAVTLGVNPKTMVTVCAIVVVALSGTATAAVGPILFLGLVAPHLARFITGPVHVWAFPYTALLAATMALAADVLGRVIMQPVEVQVGIMLGLLGGPFFIFLVTRKKMGRL